MWLLVAIALVVGVLFAVSVRAWMSVLKQEADRRECPACKGRLALTPDKDEGFALRCTGCGEMQPFAADPARRWMKGGVRRLG